MGFLAGLKEAPPAVSDDFVLQELAPGVVLLGVMVIEPYVSVQYSTIATMACANPLLLGETLEYVHEMTQMLGHVANKIVFIVFSVVVIFIGFILVFRGDFI